MDWVGCDVEGKGAKKGKRSHQKKNKRDHLSREEVVSIIKDSDLLCV